VRAWEDGGLRKAPHDPALTARVGEFLASLIQARRDHPRDVPEDVLDHLAVARWDANRLMTLDEAVRLAVFVFKAGLHTTVNSLGNCMVWLSEHLETRDLLVARPELTPIVLEELMRWESILVVTRTAVVDIELGDQKVRAGDRLILLTGSAGRDESVFDDPDSIDFSRSNVGHLMFGVGPHRCVGRHLARMEMRVALEAIHRIHPSYRADPDRPAKRYTAMSRGAKELHLLIDA
jgi:cytochrome P450